MPAPDHRHGVIRRAYAAFADRDVASLRELAHPEIEISTVTGMLTRQGEPYHGLEGVAKYIRDVAEVWDELELLPNEFHDLDSERTLVFGRVRARRGSALIDSPNAWVWRVREGMIVSAEVYGDPEAALALLADGADS